jgi:hypothetical protein
MTPEGDSVSHLPRIVMRGQKREARLHEQDPRIHLLLQINSLAEE